MPNDRLRTAMLERGFTPQALAATLGVDPKSVERWINGRTPYRRHRYAVAARLGVDEAYLWPDALTSDQVASASESEIINIYPHRWTVPSDLWRNFFDNAEREIGALVYSGLFLSEDAGVQRIFREKAGAGARVRILLGDPDSDTVAQRGADEGVYESQAAKIRNAIVMYRPLREVEGIEFRLHRTVLYNSIYRADDHLLVNTHIYGFGASQAPVLHLRRVAGGGMVTTYLDSFEQVWASAIPLD
ncbi:MAG TPA: XRE family transcriptional regulator [Kribbellaceae bacterium]|nr:XRE family transcriptional regulator [Kribbellaceae bacterium]